MQFAFLLEAAAEKAAAEAAAIPVPTIRYPVGASIPHVNILANTPDPVVQPDSAYPEWMFELVQERIVKDVDVLERTELERRWREKGILPTKRELRRANRSSIRLQNQVACLDKK